eukprot:3973730-Prymnesium_polylepis.4
MPRQPLAARVAGVRTGRTLSMVCREHSCSQLFAVTAARHMTGERAGCRWVTAHVKLGVARGGGRREGGGRCSRAPPLPLPSDEYSIRACSPSTSNAIVQPPELA